MKTGYATLLDLDISAALFVIIFLKENVNSLFHAPEYTCARGSLSIYLFYGMLFYPMVEYFLQWSLVKYMFALMLKQ